jgi:hypothetical protein
MEVLPPGCAGVAKWAVRAALLLLVQAAGAGSPEPERPDLWFPVGERLLYDMDWGVIPVGSTVVESEWAADGTSTVLHIRYTTRTNPFCDRIYRVDDLIEAWIDPATFLPIRFRKKLEEGSFRCDETTTFHRDRGTVLWASLTENRVLEYNAPPDLHDIVSLMYLLREHPFVPGATNTFAVAGDQGPTEIQVETVRAVRVDTPGYGKRPAVQLRPRVSGDSLFQRKVPDQVWISTDQRRLLLQMTVDVPLGHITMGLRTVEGPGAAEWVREHEDAKP